MLSGAELRRSECLYKNHAHSKIMHNEYELTIDVVMHLIDLADGYYYLQLNLFSIAWMCQCICVHHFFLFLYMYNIFCPSDALISASFFVVVVVISNRRVSCISSRFFLIESNSENEHLEVVRSGTNNWNAAIKSS